MVYLLGGDDTDFLGADVNAIPVIKSRLNNKGDARACKMKQAQTTLYVLCCAYVCVCTCVYVRAMCVCSSFLVCVSMRIHCPVYAYHSEPV